MNTDIVGRNGLSWERLRSFCAVAEAGSIVKAAGADPVRQSLMSRQIRELEQLFEVELIRRKGRGLVITDAGRRLATIARHQIRTLQDFDDECRGRPASFSIAGSNTFLQSVFLPRFGAIRKALPMVEWELHHLTARDAARAVVEGETDFALLRSTAMPAGVERAPLGRIAWVLAVPAEQAETGSASALSLLKVLPLALPISGELREAVDAYATKAKLTLKVVLACDSYQQALSAARAGACATIIPDILLKGAPLSLRTVQLPARLKLHQPLALVWRKRVIDSRRHGAAVRDLLRKVLAIED